MKVRIQSPITSFKSSDEDEPQGAFMSKGILYDATLCIGCKLCEKGCAERNGLPYDDTIALSRSSQSTSSPWF